MDYIQNHGQIFNTLVLRFSPWIKQIRLYYSSRPLWPYPQNNWGRWCWKSVNQMHFFLRRQNLQGIWFWSSKNWSQKVNLHQNVPLCANSHLRTMSHTDKNAAPWNRGSQGRNCLRVVMFIHTVYNWQVNPNFMVGSQESRGGKRP